MDRSRRRINEIMNHLIRLLSTTSGTDKSFMLVQYTAILLTQLIRRSKDGQRSTPLARRLTALSKLLSDARTTYRLWDLLSIFQWLNSLNGLSKSDSTIVQIERLQVISMLIYYPLEHLYFLSNKRILPLSSNLINKAALYSCRAWAAYVGLHFFHLWEDLKSLKKQRLRLSKSQNTQDPYSQSEKNETELELRRIQGREEAIMNGIIVNCAYAPLTLHWSLPNGLYSSEAITGLCGIAAAVAQLRAGWKASAMNS